MQHERDCLQDELTLAETQIELLQQATAKEPKTTKVVNIANLVKAAIVSHTAKLNY